MTDDTNLTTWRIPRQRRVADKHLLGELVRASTSDSPPRAKRHLGLSRRAFLIVAIAGGLVTGGGVAAAVVVLQSQNPTVRDVARCYSEVSSNFSSSFPGTEVTIAPLIVGSTNTDVPSQVISLCSASWRLGFARPAPGAPASSGNNPVPSLIACVLPSGEAAVFPGDAATCTKLGLSLMSPQGNSGQRTSP